MDGMVGNAVDHIQFLSPGDALVRFLAVNSQVMRIACCFVDPLVFFRE